MTGSRCLVGGARLAAHEVQVTRLVEEGGQ